uniref:Dehydrogenase/reductase SDR family member 1 n=1 Tax=Enterobius vermicularis TaxID=51028 RepID=A0A0N4UV35_ENTVE
LDGKVALVTGGSRGISKGIALQLAEAGAKVYITGRKHQNHTKTLPRLENTADEIRKRGGECVVAHCDHSEPKQVEELFRKIASENASTLDILVNSAFAGNPVNIERNGGRKFYECDPLFWDEVNNVGLRNVYICCVYGGRLMAAKHRGVIINISSAGAIQYFFNVPYGVGKAAVDRMSADIAFELKNVGVTAVSLWPGTVKTETSKDLIYSGKFTSIAMKMYESGETPEFVGRAVVALASDTSIQKKSGKVLLTGDLCKEYGFTDIDGKVPANMRSLKSALEFFGYSKAANWVPPFLNIPSVALHLSTYKF